MEQIIVTKPNGSKYPLASKRTATEIKSAKQNWALLSDDVVSISVESPSPQTYGIGDHFAVFGRVYKLNRLPKVKKSGGHSFSYELEFEGVQYDLIRATYDLTIDTTNNQLQDVQADTLTGNLRRFATVLISNANRVFPNTWVLGSCPDTIEDKTLTFGEGDNCLSVLQTLCTEFGVEFEIVQSNGKFTINFVSKVGQVFPSTFEFGKGKGLYSLDRQNVDSSNIVTRLKVYGSTSNITNKYRASRLCLPGKTKAQSYIEKPEAVAKYGIYEATKYFDDIKPTFNGSIEGLVSGSVLKFIDTKMFDLNALEADGKTTKYLIEGCAAKVHFNTGNLAGYEFEVHAYDHATKTFTLVKQTDDRGDVFPSENSSAFQFAQGNEYKLLDIALPDIPYQNDAENKLDEQGNIYYDQNSQPKVQYGLSVTKAYLKMLVGNGTIVNIFAPGDYIPVKDSDIDVDKSVRIKSLTRNLLDEYEYTLTISDTVSTNITNRVISELVDIDKIITINNLKDPTRARANWRSSREVLNMVFDPEGDYYTDKIKPNSIDTLFLSVGAKSMQFILTNTVLQPNYNGNKNVIKVQGGVLTHYTINEEPRLWVLADNTTTFTKDMQAYYIYAKCTKDGDVGSIIFSSEQIKVEQDSMFYHFWIGVVNSVDLELDVRRLSLTYGNSTINGREITTGCISASSGDTYFDLDKGEIGGKISFTSDSVFKSADGNTHTLIAGDKINTGLINADEITATHIEAARGSIANFEIQDNLLKGNDGAIVFQNESIETLDELTGTKNAIDIPLDTRYSQASATAANPQSADVVTIDIDASQNVTPVQVPYAGMLRFAIKSGTSATFVNLPEGSHAKHVNVPGAGDKALCEVVRVEEDGKETLVYSFTPSESSVPSSPFKTSRAVYLDRAGHYLIRYSLRRSWRVEWVDKPADWPEDIYPTLKADTFIAIVGQSDTDEGNITFSGSDALTKIGTDGLFSFWSALDYLYFSKDTGLRIAADTRISSPNGEYVLTINNQGISITGAVGTDASNNTVSFTVAGTRVNISTGEKLSVAFGKIARWLGDLKEVAFTGRYSDLQGTPPSLPANGGHADTATKATQDGAGNVIADTYARQRGSYPNLTVGKADNATLSGRAEKADKDGDGNDISATYVKQAGTYPGMTAGKAVADEDGNKFASSYAKQDGDYGNMSVGKAYRAEMAERAEDSDKIGGKSAIWIMSHELGNLVPHAVLGHSYGFGHTSNGWPTNGSYICFGSNNQYGPLVQIQTNHQNSAEMWTRSQENVTGIWSPWKRIAMAEELSDIVSSERIVQKSGGDMDDGATLYFQNNVGRWGATGTYFKNPHTGEVLGGIGGIGLDGDLRSLYMGLGPSPFTDDKCFKIDGASAYLYGKQVATTDLSTPGSNGLMSYQDKQKLDGLKSADVWGVEFAEIDGELHWRRITPSNDYPWKKIADSSNTGFNL